MATQAKRVETARARPLETVEVSAADRAMGAAMIASGIGSLVLGIAIVLAEVNAGAKSFLTWSAAAGPLSGKTSVAVIAFFGSWVLLHYALKRYPLTLTRSFVITLVLVVLGLLLSYPPIFESFAG
jgi:hypothetical protein